MPKTDGDIHIWAGLPMPEANNISGIYGKQFYSNNFCTIGTPGDAENVITVGSFVTKTNWTDMLGNEQSKPAVIGSKSDFSSLGPLRNGTTKPTISAPGQVIFAAHSKDTEEAPDTTKMINQYYIGFNGTSMAAPHVTGCVALMLQMKPNLTYGDIKINMQNIADYISSISGVEFIDINNTKIYPNPASEFIDLQLETALENPSIELFDIKGNKVSGKFDFSINNSVSGSIIRVNTSELNTGVYNAHLIENGKLYKFRFVVVKR